jgi:hypothetical protein
LYEKLPKSLIRFKRTLYETDSFSLQLRRLRFITPDVGGQRVFVASLKMTMVIKGHCPPYYYLTKRDNFQ